MIVSCVLIYHDVSVRVPLSYVHLIDYLPTYLLTYLRSSLLLTAAQFAV